MTDRLLRVRDVLSQAGISHAYLYLLMQHGRFPKPCAKLGRSVRWSELDVQAWIAARKHEGVSA